jgi:glycine/D-amino acid oxidase-like deaminating enzyme
MDEPTWLWRRQTSDLDSERESGSESQKKVLPEIGVEKLPVAADVAIIGGGFTGLSAARNLKRAFPGLNVLVIEEAFVGFGASGRNSGYLNSQIGDATIEEMVSRLGLDQAAHVVGLGQRAVRHCLQEIEALDLAEEVDLTANGIVFAATTAAQFKKARQMKEAADRLDDYCRLTVHPTRARTDAELWDSKTCAERLHSTEMLGAYYDPLGANFNPFALARGLLERGCLPLGIRVHERARVEAVEGRAGGPKRLTVVDTASSETRVIDAEVVVHATNGYPGPSRGPSYRRRMAPLHVYSIASEPLSEEQLSGYYGDAKPRLDFAFYTLHHLLYAFRITPDRRVVCSTGPSVSYFAQNRLHVRQHPRAYAQLREFVRGTFPALARAVFAHEWEGVISATLHDFPIVGAEPSDARVFYSLAYCGHGVALSNYAGVILRDLFARGFYPKYALAADEPPFRDGLAAAVHFVNPPRHLFPPVPGEPLRKPVAALYLAVLRLRDRPDLMSGLVIGGFLALFVGFIVAKLIS